MECARVGTSVTATHSESSSVAGQEISITFTSITNPSSTQPTNSFVIYTQEQVSGTYYSIDGKESGLTYSVSTLGSISDINVTRDTIDASNNGLKVNRNTNFLFDFVIPNQVATDGAFTIIMPTESDAQIDTTATSTTCRASDCTSGATLACTVTSSTRTVLITDYCSSGSGRSCTAASTISICLTSDFMKNMGWIKSPLTSTDSFEVKSGVAGGVYFTDGVNASLTASPSLLPDLMSFTTPEFTRTSDTVNAKIDWEIYLTFTTNSLPQTGYIYLTLPDDVIYDMSEIYDVYLTSNSSTLVTNTKTLYSTGALNVLNVQSV